MLMGSRFDKAFDGTTDMKVGSITPPVLSADDPDTAANELRTHLIITGDAVDKNEGMFSMGELLGGGMASDEGSRFVDSAVETISRDSRGPVEQSRDGAGHRLQHRQR